MTVAVLHGTLSEAEQDVYIRQVTAKYPISIIEKLILDVEGDHVDVRCKTLRKSSAWRHEDKSNQWKPTKEPPMPCTDMGGSLSFEIALSFKVHLHSGLPGTV